MSVTRPPDAKEVQFFGGFSIAGVDARLVAELARQPKRIALLAILAAAPDAHPVRRETVAALLWPEADRDRARASVRNALYQIRSILGVDLVARRGDEELALDPSLAEVDVARLDRAAAVGDDAGVLAIYRAPFLDGFHVSGASVEWEEWLDQTRRRLASVAQRAAWREAARCEHAGDASASLLAAHRAITINGLDELSYRRAMELALRVGDRGTALSMYAELERRLRREFDVAPSPETARLVADVRQDSVVAPLAAKASTAPRPPARTPPLDPAAHPLPASSLARGAASGRGRTAFAGIGFALVVLVVAGIVLGRRSAAEPSAIEASWTAVGLSVSVRAAARADAAYATDSAGGIVQFGGMQDASGSTSNFRPLNDLWQLLNANTPTNMEWRPMTPTGDLPRSRWIARIVGDPSHDRIYMFGGAHGTTSPCANDTWVIENASMLRAPSQWKRLRTTNDPSPRADFEFAFDTASGKLIVVGGHDCIRQRFGDVWTLESRNASAAWQQLQPDTTLGAPSPRSSAAYAWDPVGRRLLLFGGHDDRAPNDDLWVLWLAPTPRWRPLSCAGDHPPAISGAMATYDATRDRMIIVGGVTAEAHSLSTIWILDGSRAAQCRWTKATVRGDPISARGYGFVTWDERAQMAIVVGGIVANSGLNDVWQLRLRDSGTK